MNDSKIPVRYSKSVFDIALEKNCLDKVYADMKVIRDIFSMKEVREVLDNPVIVTGKRREIVGALLSDKKIDKLTERFLDLVFSEGREKYLPAMARDFIELTRKRRGISEVVITTATSMSKENKEEVSKLIGRKLNSKVELVEKSDDSLIGGFILQVDDTYIDASVKNRINRFRKEFGTTY